MALDERALAFRCGGDTLYGIATLPDGPCARGVLVVVGGPQYRAGSHRQFTLLARYLATAGIAAMRFDYRGMGDSEGDARGFEDIGADLGAAIDAFMAVVPGMREVVLWGLCDGASAIAMYAGGDARVAGLVMLNPWVRTDEGIARTTLKHYYRARLGDPAFWRKMVQGKFDIMGSLRSMLRLARTAAARPREAQTAPAAPYLERMRAGLQAFTGPVLVIIGGADLTGREFCDLSGAASGWKRLLAAPRVTQRLLDQADHTFSRRAWRDQVAAWTCDWLRSW